MSLWEVMLTRTGTTCRKGIPSRGNSKCKVPSRGTRLLWSKNSQQAGARSTVSEGPEHGERGPSSPQHPLSYPVRRSRKLHQVFQTPLQLWPQRLDVGREFGTVDGRQSHLPAAFDCSRRTWSRSHPFSAVSWCSVTSSVSSCGFPGWLWWCFLEIKFPRWALVPSFLRGGGRSSPAATPCRSHS